MADESKRIQTEQGHNHSEGESEWFIPKPEKIPKPTYWPMTLAFGLTLMLWGVVTSRAVSVLGLMIFILAAAKWIGDIRHEQND
jgi:hypothetical protein